MLFTGSTAIVANGKRTLGLIRKNHQDLLKVCRTDDRKTRLCKHRQRFVRSHAYYSVDDVVHESRGNYRLLIIDVKRGREAVVM